MAANFLTDQIFIANDVEIMIFGPCFINNPHPLSLAATWEWQNMTHGPISQAIKYFFCLSAFCFRIRHLEQSWELECLDFFRVDVDSLHP